MREVSSLLQFKFTKATISPIYEILHHEICIQFTHDIP